jgi:hypothetical protein
MTMDEDEDDGKYPRGWTDEEIYRAAICGLIEMPEDVSIARAVLYDLLSGR